VSKSRDVFWHNRALYPNTFSQQVKGSPVMADDAKDAIEKVTGKKVIGEERRMGRRFFQVEGDDKAHYLSSPYKPMSGV
jgi:hypothetical protein